MNKTELIARAAREPEDRLLLARVLDKYEQARRRNIPAATPFLSPREQQLAQGLLRAAGVRDSFALDGGYEGAERKILVFLPDWADPSLPAEGELVFLRAAFHGADSALTHRDILGSLMGLGVERDRVGDILVSPHSADIVALPSLRDFFLREWTGAGRVKLTVTEIGREALAIPPVRSKLLKDTVSSLRLDAVAAAAFSMSRGRAAELIAAGRVNVDHMACLKPDRQLEEGALLTVRGLGRARLAQINGQTRKGRTGVTIERYL